MTRRSRTFALVAAAVLLISLGGGYTVYAAGRNTDKEPAADGALTLSAPGRIVFRDTSMGSNKDRVVSVDASDPSGHRTPSPINCQRFYAAGGTAVCLRVRPGAMTPYWADILDSHLKELKSLPLVGAPSRARVSPSGRMAAWTSFNRGDSYANVNFSTRTSILDTRTGAFIDSLEKFSITMNGKPYSSPDINLWGVTFADDNRFYATLASKSHTYLVEGNVAARTVRTLRENVECPSLSPDGTRLVFKKRIHNADWRLTLLDLKTMAETPLAEQRSVDDQGFWRDDHTVIYALPKDRGFGFDLWTVPADGSGTPKMFLPGALSPALTG